MGRISVLKQMVAVSPSALIGVIGVGILAAVANTVMLATINQMIQGEAHASRWGAAFGVALLVKSSLNVLADYQLVGFSIDLLMNLQRDTFQRVLAAPIRELERVGHQRIVTLLTDDLESIQDGFMLTPYIATHAMVLLGGAAYLAWVFWPLLIGLVALACVALAFQRTLLASNHALMTSFYDAGDRFADLLYGATRGAKELKLSGFLRSRLTREVYAQQVQLESLVKKASMRGTWAETVTQFMLYGVLGGVAFVVPLVMDVTNEVLAQYVVAILFLVGPLRALLGVQKSWIDAGAAVDRVAKLRDELGSQTEVRKSSTELPKWDLLSLKGATYRYESTDSASGFSVGPIDLTIQRGELVFFVGGNGSGKTTLLKLMMGLYPVAEGSVLLDETPLSECLEVREMFGGVLADHYLFPWVQTQGEKQHQLLERVALSDKVRIDNGEYSNIKLSQGQRARLALVSALAEQRAFYVFDEWAAEQDPQFREYFYLQLLPQLKERGITVVAATHDDRYFHVADRVVHLDRGKIWNIETLRH